MEPSFRIYVGNLPWQVDDARLEQVFSEHGKVTSARVVLERETGRSRGFGFVTMSSEIEVNDAIAALDGQVRPYISMLYIVHKLGSDFLSKSIMFFLPLMVVRIVFDMLNICHPGHVIFFTTVMCVTM